MSLVVKILEIIVFVILVPYLVRLYSFGYKYVITSKNISITKFAFGLIPVFKKTLETDDIKIVLSEHCIAYEFVANLSENPKVYGFGCKRAMIITNIYTHKKHLIAFCPEINMG